MTVTISFEVVFVFIVENKSFFSDIHIQVMHIYLLLLHIFQISPYKKDYHKLLTY